MQACTTFTEQEIGGVAVECCSSGVGAAAVELVLQQWSWCYSSGVGATAVELVLQQWSWWCSRGAAAPQCMSTAQYLY